MRRRRHVLQVSTFPFLAVLLCTMGSLILILLVIDRRARVAAVARAQRALVTNDEARARKLADARAESERRLAALHARLIAQDQELGARLQAVGHQLRQAAGGMEQAQGHQAEIQQHLREEQQRLAQRRHELTTRQGQATEKSAETAAARAEMVRLSTDVDALERALAELKVVRLREQKTYSVIPYRGSRGDDRRPIYVECTVQGLILHPDRLVLPGDAVRIKELRAEVQRRLARQQASSTEARTSSTAQKTPYLLFLVRPDGINTYHRTVAALDGLSFDYGYEFIDADWALDFSDGDEARSQPWMTATQVPAAAATASKPGERRVQGVMLGKATPNGEQVAGGSQAREGEGSRGQANPGGPGGSFDAAPSAGLTLPPAQGAASVGGGRGGGPGLGAGDLPGGGDGGGTPGGPAVLDSGSGQGAGAVGGSRGGGPMPAGSGFAGDDARGTGPNDSPAITLGLPRPSSSGTGVPVGASVSGGTRDPQLAPAGRQQAGTGEPGSENAGGTGWRPQRGPGTGSAGSQPSTPGSPDKGGGTEVAGGVGPGTGSDAPPSATMPASPRYTVPGTGGTPSAGTSASGSTTPTTATAEGNGQPGQGGRPGAGGSGTNQGGSPGGGTSGGSASSGSGSGSGEPGEPGDGGPGFPSSPLEKGRRPSRPPTPRLSGNRDWFIPIECNAQGATLSPSGPNVALGELVRGTGGDRLADGIRQLIARRQASVRPGEPPYRPMLRFVVHPNGLETYYRVYPLLEPLALPMSRQNVEPE